MSINWSFKSEDLDEIISKLEKEKSSKDKEITENETILNELLKKTRNVEDKIRTIASKLEFAEKEIYRLSQKLENTNLNITDIKSEIYQINQQIQEKELDINELTLLKEKIELKSSFIEKEIIKRNDFNLNLFFNQFKKHLNQKGFITQQEFEDLKIKGKN